ncbi:hypothetical protein CK203_092620 [Vitis vinifera]|uniref:Retrotransposon gag domain-containing protein n=1 Tax=Vitis vinifera TaxID=29760 RepID=A0A438BUR9_VITVI|nr:hypothetical protein CK203_092620 [Vitis vinifera]
MDHSYATWDVENSMIMAWLVNSMEEEISSNYMCYPTSKALWDNIIQMYSDLGNQSQIYELQLKLGDICQGEVFFEVHREESWRNVMLEKKLSEPVENSALLGTVATASRNPNNQRRLDDKPRVWCDHCNKSCHTRETCWKLHGKPTD